LLNKRGAIIVMKRSIVVPIAVISSITTILTITMVLIGFSWHVSASATAQQTTENIEYRSISSLSFLPLNQSANYVKDPNTQRLGITGQTRVFSNNNNVFVAPLVLPNQSRLIAVTLFGQDFDPQGEIGLRLKRCDHSQARCVVLLETTSTVTYSAGIFETTKLATNELIDNNIYNYILEAELTALANSGLRSVRLDVITPQKVAVSASSPNQWDLSGTTYGYRIPTTGFTQVKVCAGDLSHLNNTTHYPYLTVDDSTYPLDSNECVIVWGYEFEVHRELNTGSSSGSYEILR